MGKTYDRIDERMATFLSAQHVFFVGSAPVGADGHVNVSPKGLDSFRVLDPTTVAYLDLTGSGVETIAHLRDNGRITLLFCAFEGPPRIVRLYGRGEVVRPADAAFADLAARFPSLPGRRSVIRVHLQRIADSCGYAVPTYRYVGARDQLELWAERKGADGIAAYQRERNGRSIDGLPGLDDE
ncbi:MAG TPA: pyridoxamine 5'-phosphate oxidase family protein [Candidatus Dormibacteraeota bacterium]|nr:pyridoxamine 5'-phosphate oxidase family protein [Candidatus Dormibacteraeota bacterium]